MCRRSCDSKCVTKTANVSSRGFHGKEGDKTGLILPDGQLGFANRLVPTEEPFQPLTADQLEIVLRDGPFAEYNALEDGSLSDFLQVEPGLRPGSGRLLDDLYKGLIGAFRRNGFPVHDTEFPLVAVIFATESDFRAHKQVDPAGPGLLRILHQSDLLLPEIRPRPDRAQGGGASEAADRRTRGGPPDPLQYRHATSPRRWPPWLVEGLAEYCATTVTTKKGIVWSGMGAINPCTWPRSASSTTRSRTRSMAPIFTRRVARQRR